MNIKFNGTTVETNGVRSIYGGGTNASTATGALANLGGYPISNPSGFITGIENLVYTTGDQTISGAKTFNNDIYIKSTGTNPAVLYVESGRIGINNEYPQASLDISGSVFFSERPFVNSIPFMLSGDINTSNFYTNNNPSGFITGVENLIYTTGDQNISGVKNFIQRPTVNGTGILLEGEVQNNTIISGVLYSAQVNVKNNHTGTLYKGQPVYINGAAGGNILVGLASNTGEASSSKTLGLIYQNSLAVNAFGTVITDGLLSNFNVGSAAAGDPIWLGPTGNLIYGLANKPVAPNHLVYLGVVTRTNNSGEVFVKVQNGYELDELHDVSVKNSPTGQFLFKNIESQWSGKYLQISDVSGLESSLNQKQTAGDYYLNSNPSGFISSNIVGLSGASSLANIVQITQSGYNAIVAPATGTLYIIVG